MANESNILKEFLVAVGFKVDEDGFRRFQINMQTLVQRLSQLAIGAAAVSAAIIVAVDKSASAFEKLANQSQRTNTSVKDLQALGFAASQFGSTWRKSRERSKASPRSFAIARVGRRSFNSWALTRLAAMRRRWSI
jgi:hypothetical protein